MSATLANCPLGLADESSRSILRRSGVQSSRESRRWRGLPDRGRALHQKGPTLGLCSIQPREQLSSSLAFTTCTALTTSTAWLHPITRLVALPLAGANCQSPSGMMSPPLHTILHRLRCPAAINYTHILAYSPPKGITLSKDTQISDTTSDTTERGRQVRDCDLPKARDATPGRRSPQRVYRPEGVPIISRR